MRFLVSPYKMWGKLKPHFFSFISMILALIHRKRYVRSKTVIFMFGLAVSYVIVRNGVVDLLADYLEENKFGSGKSTILVNILDFMSSVFSLAVVYVSEAYTGRFRAIIVCTAAYIMGLVLLCIRASVSDNNGLIWVSILLIALGVAGKDPTLEEFFDYQLSEEVKKRSADQKNEGKDDKKASEEDENDILWWITASMIGFALSLMILDGVENWFASFVIAAISMGATYFLFFYGNLWYYPEEKPSQSPLTIICRVFKTAFMKHTLSYPSSEQGYNNEGLDDIKEKHLFHRRDNGKVYLLPLYFPFLDKAAMTNNVGENVEVGNDQEVCTVEQVRDVKTLHLIIPLGIPFWAYSLVSASGNTYFVLQTSNLKPDVRLNIFFIMLSLVAFVVRKIQSSSYKMVRPHWSMAVGLFCSVLCCIAAWQVEHHRLRLIKSLVNPEKDSISLSVMILTPQYLLLGLSEAFTED